MGALSIGPLVCPYFVTENLYPRLGRRMTTLIGLIGMSLSLLLYGLGYFIPDPQKGLFIVCGIFTRLLEGGGLAIAQTAMVSLISKLFPDELGFAQSARLIGCYSGITLGVVVGALLRDNLGYFGVFLTFSVVVILTSFLIFVFEEDRSTEAVDHSITHWELFKVRRVFLVVVSCLCTDSLHYSLESILALKLRLDFAYSTSAIGAFFGVFLAGTLLVGVASLCIPEKWEKRGFIIAVLWVNVVAALLIGPSQVLRLPNSPALIGVGLFLGGSTRSLTASYFFVEGAKGGVADFPSQEERIGDIISSFYIVGSGLIFMASLVIGSALSSRIGFRSTLDVEALVFLLNALIYTFFTVSDLRKE